MWCVTHVYVGMEITIYPDVICREEQNCKPNRDSTALSVKLMYSQLSNAERWRHSYSAMHPNFKNTINNE
jgi:hypothetical protein